MEKSKMDNGIKLTNRITVVDGLRGFAISAILLIHTSNHFLYGVFPPEEPQWLSSLGLFLMNILHFLFEGKAYAIFALLFGFTFALQCHKQKEKGMESAWRLMWRMLLLIGFGFVNAAFFSGGDPLVFYALCMLVLIPLQNLSLKQLGFLSALFLLQPLDIINQAYTFWGNEYEKYYVELSRVVASGDFFRTLWTNGTIGIKACLLWAVETGRTTQAIGLFLVGMILYKKRLLTDRLKWSNYFYVFFIVALFFHLIRKSYFPQVVSMYYNLAFAGGLISLFVFLYSRLNPQYFNWMQIYGRMSLTNFIAQSIFGSFVFYPWGLGLAKSLGIVTSLTLSFCFLVLQVQFSKWWLKSHKRGPLESIWHRITWINMRIL